MNSIQHLRGPDDSGTLNILVGNFRCTLGHTRLAIIDREGGKQPMSHLTSGVSLVFNGEIYNHQQLRLELQNIGLTFRSRSDTEVLLQGYHAWGIEGLLKRIDGMFAFAIADPHKNQLYLARDPAGQKPLYYTTGAPNKNFAFASTLKALASIPWFARDIDQNAVELFLNLRVIPAPHSIYRMARKLEPGQYLAYNGQTATTKEYWSPFAIPLRSDFKSEKVLLEEYRSLLSSTLSETVVADVPVSLLLSSGVDSASLASELSKLSNRATVSAYTVAFPQKGYDESKVARAIGLNFGLCHQIIPYQENQFDNQLETLSEIMDEPFGDPSILPSLQLCKTVADRSRVAISGDGADELFGGYPTFNILPFWPLLNKFPNLTSSLCNWGSQLFPLQKKSHSAQMKFKRLAQGLGYPDMMAFARWLCVFSPEETSSLLGKKETSVFDDFVTTHLTEIPGEDTISQMCRSYFRLFLPGVLEKMDRASMQYSLEIRTPFLERRMIEFALSLPSRFKLHRGTTKYLMRKSLEKQLPAKLVYAPKKGFIPPLSVEFSKRWGVELLEMMGEICDNFGLERASIMNMVNEQKTFRHDHLERLWLIYQLGLFQRNNNNAATAKPTGGFK